MVFLYLFSIGVFCVAWWPVLPDQFLCIVLALTALFCCCIKPTRWLGAMLAGVLFGILAGQALTANQLPEQFDKVDLLVKGRVVELPQQFDNKVRFYFQIEAFVDDSIVEQDDYFQRPERVLLSWYYPKQSIEPDQWLTLRVRLRRPRGTVNPGGFDYQAWLLRKGVSATGYVRQYIASESMASTTASLHGFRYSISQSIQRMALSAQAKALLVALTVGDKQYINKDSWNNFAKAGVVHLLVISGLHIGFSAMVGFWLGSGLARCLSVLGVHVVARSWGLVASLSLAVSYAALAGWSIPTQRATVMVAVIVLAKLFARHITRGTVFGASLALVAIIDSLAVLDGGFWLSFTAVAILLWAFPTLVFATENTIEEASFKDQLLAKFWLFFQVQLVISAGLIALLIILGLPFSVVSPLVNLFAIPWVSLVIVPLCLAGIGSFVLSEQLAGVFWYLAGVQLDFFAQLADGISQIALPVPDIAFAASPATYLALFIALVLMLLPMGVRTKIPAAVILVALFNAQVKPSALKLTVLDVGQGLAVVVQTPQHSLVYDTGPRFSKNFSAGDAIVAPFVRAQGLKNIDALLVSHDDSDHAGGVAGFVEKVKATKIIAEPAVDLSSIDEAGARESCQHRKHWQWDAVQFTLINPQSLLLEADINTSQQHLFVTDNNQSCMLLIEYKANRLLLTGDIEKPVEQMLIGAFPQLENISLLIAPHHGSKTSSSRRFVEYSKPKWVVFSAGYKHHFGHPHQQVVQRYARVGSQQFNTASSGAISFDWTDKKALVIHQQRRQKARYWFAGTSPFKEP